MSKIYLYKDGKEYNTNITGGLFNKNLYYNNASIELINNCIYFNCQYPKGGLIQSTNIIDLSKYKAIKIRCDIDMSSSWCSNVGVKILSRHFIDWQDTANDIILTDSFLTTPGKYKDYIFEVNLENIQEGIICIGGISNFNVYEIYLETKDTLSETIKKATKDTILNNKLFQEYCVPYGEE